ncbi:MAG: tetratricopeptide repeat protein, partial [Chitinophagaceae bacterium]
MFINCEKYFTTYSWLIILFVYSVGCSSAHKTQNLSENSSNTDPRLKRQMKAGEKHQYSLDLKAGEFTHIKAGQFDIDVMAKISLASDNWQEIVDSPNGELDSEDIYLMSTSGGKYEIEIYPAQKYADPGAYDIKIVRLSKASEADKKWMAALAATQKGSKLRAKSETRQQSIPQFELAMAEWKDLNDPLQYARAMRSLGFVYIREKNYEKAVEVFTQLLPQWKQLGDVRGEGFTYLIIGRIYNLQKNYSKALENNLNSLEYWRRVKDTDQESFVLMDNGNHYANLGDKQKSINAFEQALKINEQSARPSVKA